MLRYPAPEHAILGPRLFTGRASRGRRVQLRRSVISPRSAVALRDAHIQLYLYAEIFVKSAVLEFTPL